MARKKSASAKKAKKTAPKRKVTPAKKVAASPRKSVPADMPIRKINRGNVEVWVLGTAHVSAKSIEDVKTSFAKLKPDSVCVELCKSRFDAMNDPDRWRNLDISRLIKDRKIWLLASSLILSAFQKKIGETTGSKPGAEMLQAVRLSEENGTNLVLADREIRTTLRRAWHRVGFFSKMWLVSYLFASLLVNEDIEAEEIEKLKNEDVLTDLFNQLPSRYDAVKRVIIDERDQYLAENIRRAADDLAANSPGRKKKKILAVVGAGHVPGIARVLDRDESVDRDDLDDIPDQKRWKTVLSLGTFAATLGAGSVAYYWYNWDPGKMVLVYFLSRAGGAALGAILARAHLVTILVTTLLAPVALVIAFFGPRLWMFSALTEVYFREPRVEDFENLSSLDLETTSGFLDSINRNRVLKLFMVIFLVSLGLTLGNLTCLATIATGG